MSLQNYMMKKKSGFKHLLKEITLHKTCYLFLAPYAIIFGLFVVAPVVVSIFYSFTYYNILETPKFIGLRN